MGGGGWGVGVGGGRMKNVGIYPLGEGVCACLRARALRIVFRDKICALKYFYYYYYYFSGVKLHPSQIAFCKSVPLAAHQAVPEISTCKAITVM